MIIRNYSVYITYFDVRKKRMRVLQKFYFFFLIGFISSPVIGQYQIGLIPRISSDNGVSKKIGFTQIEIRYGAPSANGRKLWGDLVPYDKVWRAGANEATTMYFSEDVVLNDTRLSKGIYSFFVIPKKSNRWTVVFNSIADQWGAFNHDPEKDVLALEVEVETAEYKDILNYSIHQLSNETGEISMQWGDKKLYFNLICNTTDQFRDILTEKVEAVGDNVKWVVYLQGAEYLLHQDTLLNLALEWANKSEALAVLSDEWNKQYYPKSFIMGHLHWVKANLYAKSDDYDNALYYADKLKAIKGQYTFYVQEQESENIDATVETWMAQRP